MKTLAENGTFKKGGFRARSNLFSGWRDENYEVWLRNRFRLSRYMWVVEPVMPLR